MVLTDADKETLRTLLVQRTRFHDVAYNENVARAVFGKLADEEGTHARLNEIEEYLDGLEYIIRPGVIDQLMKIAREEFGKRGIR